MTQAAWTNYTDRVRATHWFERFPEGDGRRLLTWKGRFANVTNIVNFYSSQDEVVCNGDGRPKDIAREYAWYNQETLKGMWPFMLHEYEGGWEFNGYYNITTNYWIGPVLQTETYHMPPVDADQLTDAQLQEIPFFLDFHNPEMHTSPNGAIVASNYLYRAEMLAYSIPAESFAVGANPGPKWGAPAQGCISRHSDYSKGLIRNVNMARNCGPDTNEDEANGDDKELPWIHRYFIKNSLFDTTILYEAIVDQIGSTKPKEAKENE